MSKNKILAYLLNNSISFIISAILICQLDLDWSKKTNRNSISDVCLGIVQTFAHTRFLIAIREFRLDFHASPCDCSLSAAAVCIGQYANRCEVLTGQRILGYSVSIFRSRYTYSNHLFLQWREIGALSGHFRVIPTNEIYDISNNSSEPSHHSNNHRYVDVTLVYTQIARSFEVMWW